MSQQANKRARIPELFQSWFAQKQWTIRPYQKKMVTAFVRGQSSLLIAPTGAGKTLSGFLPSLIDLFQQQQNPSSNKKIGLHTLYISPLKALTHDIERNLHQPISQMQLNIDVATRTGDTTAYQRQKQRRSPPHILLTTPESLMLMLSYTDAPSIFANLKCVIIDEAHSFANTKRGDFTSLALARLEYLCKGFVRFGLSATVAYPELLASWLGPSGDPCALIEAKTRIKPRVKILKTNARIPFGGYMAKYAIKDVYKAINDAQTTIVFVNTRATAELIFQALWEENSLVLPIAIYHGSLSKEQRSKTELMMAQGKLKAIVATSALELGIDWGDVDLVIQMGAPKGVSRLLQRIGRSNHRLDEPSKALLVPGNRFEALECLSAIHAIKRGELDGDPPASGALDIIPQFILNCLCSEPAGVEGIYQQVLNAPPYGALDFNTFVQLWAFTQDGGYALQAYERYNRLQEVAPDVYKPTSKRVIMRHRQNIGTIVEAGRLKVKRLRRAHQGKIIGEVEEYFAQQLVKGDTFYFAGEVLRFEGIRDMMVEAKPGKAKEPKIPSYVGGQMPLSSYLADAVRALLNDPDLWQQLPKQVIEWLELQRKFSMIPAPDRVLIEQFTFRKAQYVLFYTFEGRKANQTLGMLITRRMEKMGLHPLSFSITDYGLSICSIEKVEKHHIPKLFNPDILGDELEDWMLEAAMLKRSFRRVAVVSGLIEQQYHSTKKSMRQVTFSTDLIYDTLREYDKDHVLLRVTREDAERELLDLSRTADLLIRFDGAFDFIALSKPSPMAIPIVLDVRSEIVTGAGTQMLLEQANLYQEAENMMEDIRALLSGAD
ncbi:ligase-associated DNA damage response DEXH box helicase [Glaciecola sp. XM2]|uniref:ligase-associated DNA damage response DEXH box helicase n=1 Tax=Glaciecola sp. XM2 TaxID=1914931 RepID=UPI001BDF3B6F|nr:ligase-associated DNA damage response DEXH box helicase [Glaciecola sp. XM2]